LKLLEPIIILTDPHDISTDQVINWIDYWKQTYLRINSGDLFDEFCKFKINDSMENQLNHYVTIRGYKVNLSQVKSVWYRRSILDSINEVYSDDLEVHNQIKSFVIYELRYGTFMFYRLLEDAYWINKPWNSNNDKLYTLLVAKRIGIKVPETIVTNNREEVKQFLKKNKSIIIKPIYNVEPIIYQEEAYVTFTKMFFYEDLEKLKDRFFPTLFQEKIEKYLDIRVFYLDGLFYSMAIFSQLDSQTKLDFRKYNSDKPNRMVPFKLPKNIEIKLNKLMNYMKLNSGSIDMIMNENNDYYFLEVNPVGQFGMVSINCNYFLEKLIAKHLCTQQ
jgi:ATP-GRASP peptide maturase of grasp-with-spasm system